MTDTHRFEGMSPAERLRAEAHLEKVQKRENAWLRKEHLTIPCECDPRSSHRCTRGGWIRCNARLAALSAKRKEWSDG